MARSLAAYVLMTTRRTPRPEAHRPTSVTRASPMPRRRASSRTITFDSSADRSSEMEDSASIRAKAIPSNLPPSSATTCRASGSSPRAVRYLASASSAAVGRGSNTRHPCWWLSRAANSYRAAGRSSSVAGLTTNPPDSATPFAVKEQVVEAILRHHAVQEAMVHRVEGAPAKVGESRPAGPQQPRPDLRLDRPDGPAEHRGDELLGLHPDGGEPALLRHGLDPGRREGVEVDVPFEVPEYAAPPRLRLGGPAERRGGGGGGPEGSPRQPAHRPGQPVSPLGGLTGEQDGPARAQDPPGLGQGQVRVRQMVEEGVPHHQVE